MLDLFSNAMDFIWRPEDDGQSFHIGLHDTGGATAWGVTYNTWQAWCQMHGETTTVVDFAARPKDDFLPLYRASFWNACRCGNMGAIGIQVMDAAVGSGPGTAAKFLQMILKVEADGQIGPVTLAALNKQDQSYLNLAMTAARESFYAKLSTAKYFEKGWDRRAEACRDLVNSLLAGNH